MSTTPMTDLPVAPPAGLTHPADDYRLRWYGFKIDEYFFRFVDGDCYLAVLKGGEPELLVDTIAFKPSESDPRPAIKRSATDWARRRGLTRRGR